MAHQRAQLGQWKEGHGLHCSIDMSSQTNVGQVPQSPWSHMVWEGLVAMFESGASLVFECIVGPLLTARLVTNGSLLAADNSQLLTYSSLQ
mmetsp:Transcript_25445/g.40369  ORF Transcript_25445/g.40369 Transcript_25445/m.40369 type:complete len:91 (-) Transcript_25445:89-361(-)